MPKKILKVVELFAGVGGFRLGLEKANLTNENNKFNIVWSNQWEPKTKKQHASLVYEERFGKEHHCNKDIAEVASKDIPAHDVLVGGFPCQDYSVASTLKSSKGLLGKKGVLWWSIHRILSDQKKPTKYLILENVDRLLKSPSSQRGRDFAIILKSLEELGYAAEWRVINAAEYGMPQRRRRVFIVAYHKSSKLYKRLLKSHKEEWISSKGINSKAFPASIESGSQHLFEIKGDLVSISDSFNKDEKKTPFENTGVFIGGNVYTVKTTSRYEGNHTTLGDILLTEKVPEQFYISKELLPKWEYLKGSKKEIRRSPNGHEYHYSEGSMKFPDPLDTASRTIITGEGGRTPSRFKHVVNTKNGLRRLTPLELERLNMFPDNHTLLKGVSDSKRAFFMGNALVVGIVERIGATLLQHI